MFNKKEPPIIISIGGSLIVPNGSIDTKFLSKLNTFIRKEVDLGKRFFLVAGGGKTARHYRDAGKAVIGSLTIDDLDWLGIHATRLNAHLLRTIFKDIAHPRIIENYDKKLNNYKEPVVIGAGWKPGWSTDYDAVILARDYGARLIVNLSNIDWVYDKDPSRSKNAKPIKKMTWDEMSELVGTEWKPGINAPFDPVAAQLAKNLELTVVVTNGKNFKNTEGLVEGDSFKGTVICPYNIDADYYDREYFTGNKSGLRFFKKSSWYGNLWRFMKDWFRATVIKLYVKPKKVLDVGCGRGNLVKFLRNKGIEAYGVDISQHAIDLAEEEVKPYLRRADILRLPYADNEFDLVVSYNLIEHVEQSNIRRAINETVRISKDKILHKIFTHENTFLHFLYGRDVSKSSIFTKKYWETLFANHDQVSIVKKGVFKLPSFFESIFLIQKKTVN
jgi:uridylate kinase